MLDAIESACQLVADYPGVGRAREEIDKSVMSFPIGSYVIFYYLGDDPFVSAGAARTSLCMYGPQGGHRSVDVPVPRALQADLAVPGRALRYTDSSAVQSPLPGGEVTASAVHWRDDRDWR